MKNYCAVSHYNPKEKLHYVAIESSKKQNGAHEVINRGSDTIAKILNESDYLEIGREHDSLVKDGKSGLEIIRWLGRQIDIARWSDGEFYGRLNALSSPTPEEIERLLHFLVIGKQYSQSWAQGSGASDFVSQFFLSDGYISTKFLGHENLLKVNKKLKEMAEDWERLGRKYRQKEKYLKEHLGLEIQGRWDCLTGMRNAKGGLYEGSNELIHIVGSRLTANDSKTLTFGKTFADLRSQTFTSEAGLCLLLGE